MERLANALGLNFVEDLATQPEPLLSGERLGCSEIMAIEINYGTGACGVLSQRVADLSQERSFFGGTVGASGAATPE